MAIVKVFRCFTIFLVIKLATESQVNAFALGSRQSTETTIDIENEKSHEKTEPDIKSVVDNKTTAIPQVIVPIETTAKTEVIQKIIDKPNNDRSVSVSVNEGISGQSVTGDSQTPLIAKKSIDTKSTFEKKYNVSNLPDDESTSDSSKLNNSLNTTPLSVISINTTEPSSTTLKLQQNSTGLSENKQNLIAATIKEASNRAPEVGSVQDDTTSAINNISSSESVTTTTTLTQSTIISTETVKDYQKLKPTEMSQQTSTESPSEYFAKDETPYGKKYTTIERKRMPTLSESEQAKDTDLDRAQSAHPQAGITLEQVLGNAAIPSLKKLETEFLLITSKAPDTNLPGTLGSLVTITSPVTLPIKEPADIFTTGKTTDDNSINIGMLKPENILTSKRAGYIDYSRPITPSETTETTTTTEKSTTETKTSAMTESTRPTQETSDGLNSAMASQSLLAEDAMNEELMKEKLLNDNIVNTKNTEDSKVTTASQTQFDLDTTTPGASKNTSDDTLSVKPITKLYPVSSNYKPLKKIEVQPSKPFLRNPDDNSWRNESLNSQHIVFKANNASKTFTEVLKNKTEIELNAISDKENRESQNAKELRERLEKEAQIRKTKKNKLGISMYSDYVESGESAETTTRKAVGTMVTLTSSLSVKPDPTSRTTARGAIQTIKLSEIEENTTQMPKKDIPGNENFEDDDDDADFITIPDFDIKKHITSLKTSKDPFSLKKITPQPSQLSQFPERKPTIQYFPPRQTQKVYLNDYDDGFKSKIDSLLGHNVKTTVATTARAQTNIQHEQIKNKSFLEVPGLDTNLKKSRYNIQNDPNTGFGASAEGGYIIKHLRDFMDQASKGNDDRDAPYFMTDIPVRGITVHSDLNQNKLKQTEYEDYENEFRKEVLFKFVENFNQNSDRFKVDFPIIYNTSIVHNKDMAASRAYLKVGYENTNKVKSGCEGNCEHTVELSPEYELHYFVPEAEEREVVERTTLPAPHHHYRIPGMHQI